MDKLWTSEVIELPADARGWRSIPRYFAIETDERDVFVCPVRPGAGFWTSAQLRQWARSVGADLIMMRQVRADDSQEQLALAVELPAVRIAG